MFKSAMKLMLFSITLLVFVSCGKFKKYNTLPRGRRPFEAGSTKTFEKLLSMYGNITTVAGAGNVKVDCDKPGGNSWKLEYGGKPAVEAELSRPHHTISDDEGNLYIADKCSNAVHVVNSNGIISTFAGANDFAETEIIGPRLSLPNGIWLSKDHVYILNLGNGSIIRVAKDDVLDFKVLFTDPSLRHGRGLWASEDGETIYYSSMDKLKRWTRSDDKIISYAEGFKELGNIAVNPKTGVIYATDRGEIDPSNVKKRRFSKVYKINPSTPPINVAGKEVAGSGKRSNGKSGDNALSIGLDEVRGIWFHPLGGYFLATHRGSDIWYVDIDNKMYLFLEGYRKSPPHNEDGRHFRENFGRSTDTNRILGQKVAEIRAISIDDNLNIYITANDAGVIRKIECVKDCGINK